MKAGGGGAAPRTPDVFGGEVVFLEAEFIERVKRAVEAGTRLGVTLQDHYKRRQTDLAPPGSGGSSDGRGLPG